MPTEDYELITEEDVFDFSSLRPKPIKQNPVEQFVKQTGVGLVETIGSIPKIAQWATDTPVFKDFTDNIDKWVQERTPEDLGIAGQVGRFIGGNVPYFIPGLGIIRGMKAAGYGIKIAAATGAGVDAILNGASIAGMTYNQELKKTGSSDIAIDRANKAFMLNTAIAAPMYYFGPLATTTRKGALGYAEQSVRSGALGGAAMGIITPGMAAITETPITGAEVAESVLVGFLGTGVMGVGGKFFSEYGGKPSDFLADGEKDGEVKQTAEANETKAKILTRDRDLAKEVELIKEDVTPDAAIEKEVIKQGMHRPIPQRDITKSPKEIVEHIKKLREEKVVKETEPEVVETITEIAGKKIGREIPQRKIDLTPEESLKYIEKLRKKASSIIRKDESEFNKEIETADAETLAIVEEELKIKKDKSPIATRLEELKSNQDTPKEKIENLENLEKTSDTSKKLDTVSKIVRRKKDTAELKVVKDIEEKKVTTAFYKSVGFEETLDALNADRENLNISELRREKDNANKEIDKLDAEVILLDEGTPEHTEVQAKIDNLDAYIRDLDDLKFPTKYPKNEVGDVNIPDNELGDMGTKLNSVDDNNAIDPLTGIAGNQKGNAPILIDIAENILDIGHSIYTKGMELQDFLIRMKVSLKNMYERLSTILPDIYYAIINNIDKLPAVMGVANMFDLSSLSAVLASIGIEKYRGSIKLGKDAAGKDIYFTADNLNMDAINKYKENNPVNRKVTVVKDNGEEISFTTSKPKRLIDTKMVPETHHMFENFPRAKDIEVRLFRNNNPSKDTFDGFLTSGANSKGEVYGVPTIWAHEGTDLARTLSHEINHFIGKLETGKIHGFLEDEVRDSLFTLYPDIVNKMTPKQVDAALDDLYNLFDQEIYSRVTFELEKRQATGETIKPKTLAEEVGIDNNKHGVSARLVYSNFVKDADIVKNILNRYITDETPTETAARLAVLEEKVDDLKSNGVIEDIKTQSIDGTITDGLGYHPDIPSKPVAIINGKAIPLEYVAPEVMVLERKDYKSLGEKSFSNKDIFNKLIQIEKVGDGKILNTPETANTLKEFKDMIKVLDKKAKTKGISRDDYLREHGFSEIAIADINAVKAIRLRGANHIKWQTNPQKERIKELIAQGIDIQKIMTDLNIPQPEEGKGLSYSDTEKVLDYTRLELNIKTKEMFDIEELIRMWENEPLSKDKNIAIKRFLKEVKEEVIAPGDILKESVPGAKIYDVYNKADYLISRELEHLYNKVGFNLDAHLHTINKETEVVANALEGKIDINSVPKEIKEATLALRKSYTYLLDKFVRTMARDVKEEALIRELGVSLKQKEGEKASDIRKKLLEVQKEFNISRRGMEALDMLRLKEENYMPHIFDRGDLIQTALDKLSKYINTPNAPAAVKLKDLISRLEGGSFISQKEIPRELFFAHTMERVGAEGYKMDAALSFRVYLNSWMRKVYLEPATNAAKDQYLLLPAEQKAYAKWFIMEQLGRNTRSQTANIITSLEWIRTLGLNIGSALGNLTGIINTFTEAGRNPYAFDGLKRAMTKEGLQEFYSSGAARQIKQIAAIDELPHKLEKVRTIAGVFFNVVERGLRSHAYHTGKSKGESLGLKGDELYFYSMDYMNKTQHRYGKVGMARGMRGWKGVVTQFTSYPVKQATLIHSWLREPQGILKVMGYFAMSAGVNVTARELLNLDMSNFLGIGITYGEAMEAAMSMTEGDWEDAAKHWKLATAGGHGIVPSEVFPVGPFIGLLKQIGDTSSKDYIGRVANELTPPMANRIIDFHYALKDGRPELDEYPIYKYNKKAISDKILEGPSELKYRLGLVPLIIRTFGPKPTEETFEQFKDYTRFINEEQVTTILHNYKDAVATGDSKEIERLFNLYPGIKFDRGTGYSKRMAERLQMTREERDALKRTRRRKQREYIEERDIE